MKLRDGRWDKYFKMDIARQEKKRLAGYGLVYICGLGLYGADHVALTSWAMCEWSSIRGVALLWQTSLGLVVNGTLVISKCH